MTSPRSLPAALLGLAVASTSACLLPNPAFDEADELADGTGADEQDPSGEGDPSGDGDPTGDPSGDGDPTGDPSGDGDGDATGDGDGDDPNLDECLFNEQPLAGLPFVTASFASLDTNPAPGFESAPQNCHLVMVCSANQDACNPETAYMIKRYSSGETFVGNGFMAPQPIQIRFHPGGGECGDAALELDPRQRLELGHWDQLQMIIQLKVRLPCLSEYDVPIYVAADGSSFWDPDLTEPAALW